MSTLVKITEERLESLVEKEDRRSVQREPLTEEPEAFLWTSLDNRIPMTPVDRSDGGMAVVGASRNRFEVGFQTRVEYPAGEFRMASIVYVVKLDSDCVRIGLSWE